MADPALPAVNGVVTSSSTRTLSPHALAGVTGGILVLAVVGAAVRGVWQADPTWDPTLDVPSFSEPATPDPEDFSVTPPPTRILPLKPLRVMLSGCCLTVTFTLAR